MSRWDGRNSALSGRQTELGHHHDLQPSTAGKTHTTRFPIAKGARRPAVVVGGRDLWGRPSRPIVKPEFAGILKDFQMSLMSQRFSTQRQVYRYCKEYFEALAYPELKKNASWWWMSMNDDELLVFLTELFVAADDDNSGALDEAEFTNVMASLGLSLNQMKLIWREADADGSGAVDYEEFLPVMVKLLKVMIQMQQTKDEVARIDAPHACLVGGRVKGQDD